MNTKYLMILSICIAAFSAHAQIAPSSEMMEFYTAEWTGPRSDDTRPYVSDELLQRLKNISIEEAWGYLRNKGYNNQFERGWKSLNDEPFVGRALTAVYMPLRPEYNERYLEKGKSEGRVGASNSWPIDMLQEGDVYVADCYGKVFDGTLIGDNLGNAIYARSNTGVVFDGGARDLEGLSKIDGFNAFVRDFDPTYLRETMLTGINVPIRIGSATVFPGDAVLAKREGVIFVPPHLLADLLINAEFVSLRDQFGHKRLRDGVYTPGEIDGRWSDEIKEDFLSWLDENPGLLPMSRQELDDYLKERTW